MTLFRSYTVPAWLVRGIVTALVGAGVTSVAAWSSLISNKSNDHEKRIAVMEDHTRGIDKSLDEIKDALIRIEGKIDRPARRK